MENLTELNKLDAYLREHNYRIHRLDVYSDICDTHQIKVYSKDGKFLWDAICHRGSYGYERGLIEIMGSIVTPEEKEYDDVVGYLSAEDIIKRLEK